jgi:hypothetical protein
MSSAKTIFNYVATYNPFERAFAAFLDQAADVDRFASLGNTEQEPATTFRVDYVKPNGATGYYFPDFVVAQETHAGEVNWIIETKGRLWPGTEAKDAAIELWCQRVSTLTGTPWRYRRVDQGPFEKLKPNTFAQLMGSADSPGLFSLGEIASHPLQQGYDLSEPAVQLFIGANPDLVPLLERTREAIREYFGRDVGARISVWQDMESDIEEPELAVSILTDAPDRVKKLHEFDRNWWLQQPPSERSRIVVELGEP